jgi:heme-degrading monooxygenase HmoA
MFTVIISFPPIKEGKDAEFQKWFSSSNQAFSAFKGFKSRKLLKPFKGDTYAAVVEMENRDGFEKMYNSNIHETQANQVRPMFDGKPNAMFYEVIQGS